MTEKEKMLAGKYYEVFGDGLGDERLKAHELCMEYNNTPEREVKKRERILSELMPDRGKNVYLQGPVFFDYGTNISMGEGSYANFNFTVLDGARVKIGKNVFIGPNVSLVTPIHPLRHEDRNLIYDKENNRWTNIERAGEIIIEDNCWICTGVTVCANVTIGEGSVIGAGSVVTHDIPPNSLAAGVPCRVIRKITEADAMALQKEYL